MDAQERPFERREQAHRVLQPEELRRVVTALTGEPDHVRAFYLTVLLTGYRRSEVQRMRWEELDLGTAVWIMPASTSKRGVPQTLPLPQALLPYLDRLPRVSPGVFDQAERANWMSAYVWRRIQHRAQLSECTMLTLRYSFFTHCFVQRGNHPARLDQRRLRAFMNEYAQAVLN